MKMPDLSTRGIDAVERSAKVATHVRLGFSRWVLRSMCVSLFWLGASLASEAHAQTPGLDQAVGLDQGEHRRFRTEGQDTGMAGELLLALQAEIFGKPLQRPASLSCGIGGGGFLRGLDHVFPALSIIGSVVVSGFLAANIYNLTTPKGHDVVAGGGIVTALVSGLLHWAIRRFIWSEGGIARKTIWYVGVALATVLLGVSIGHVVHISRATSPN